MEDIIWQNSQGLPSRSFTCGYCSNPLASQVGWIAIDRATGDQAFIYVCHFCQCPTFFDTAGNQFPAESIGQAVNDIPEKSVEDLYEETRRVTGVGAYTAAGEHSKDVRRPKVRKHVWQPRHSKCHSTRRREP